MDYKKKILILAGAGVHSKVVHSAKEMGLYTIVTDYLIDSPAKRIADESWNIDIMDVDAIVKKSAEVGIDGVINFCIDPAQRPYLEICERLNLPCYTTRNELDILTNKRSFKDYCSTHGVDVIPEYSFEDILKDLAEYPLFIKPSVNRGSRGQFVCQTKDEAIIAYQKSAAESFDGLAICEKYMAGKQDLGTAFFVVNGEPYLVKLGDRILGLEEDGLNNQVMCTQLPSKFSGLIEEKVSNRIKAMIKSMGIKYGPVFLQGFIDGDTVRFYDPARRMPGGDYDLILRNATGFDTVKSMIHFALTGDNSFCYGNPNNCYLLNGGTALLFTISVRPGTITQIVGMEDLLKHPYVVYGRIILDTNTTVPSSGDIKQRALAIGAYVPSGKSSANFAEELYSTCHILDENGQEMIVSRVNTSKL